MTNSMTRYETVFESTKNLPRFIEIGHGENADLYTSITDCGVPVSLSGYTVSALYQPSSKWGTTEYYSCPLEVVGNTVIIHWSHLQDNGDNGVKMWVSFSKDDELAYPALYKIGLFQTPGFEPSPITPIPEVLDFSLYTLLNAPWIPMEGNVLVTGNLSTDHDIIHVDSRIITYKNLYCSNDIQEYFADDITVSYDADYASELIQTTSESIPVKVQGELVSTGETVVIEAVLTSPEFVPPYFDEVTWQVKDAGTESSIGTLTFKTVDDEEYPHVVRGAIYGDAIIASYFLSDTSEKVETSKNYIYDVSNIESDISTLSGHVNEVESSLSSYATTASLSAYATTESLSAYATKASLSAYATTSSLSNYATTASLSDYATTDSLSAYATKASLSVYATTNSLSAYEEKTNKVTAINAQSTDAQYPSAKCMYDLIGNLETIINSI